MACLGAAIICMGVGGVIAQQPKGGSPSKNLRIAVVGVEGGAAILFVTPEGKSLLIDTGWPPGIGGQRPTPGAPDPLVAIMQNGPTKGGDEAVIKTVMSYPSLQGFWRIHYSVRYPDLNGDPNYIANLEGTPDQGNWFKVDITPGGEITVSNTRNNFSKTLKARAAG